MKVTVFSCIRKNRSMDRYAVELARNFPPGTDVHQVWFERAQGLRGRIRDHFKYLRIASREQGDVNVIVSPGYSFLLRAIEPGRTLIVCHDVHPLLDPDLRDIRHRIYAERFRHQLRQMQRAAWIVTVSEHTRQHLLRFFPGLSPEKVVAIHNGLDTKWKRVTDQHSLDEFRRQHGFQGRGIVLHVGNDVWYKNLPAVLRAFANVSELGFTLVHAGSITPQTQALAADLALGDRFIQLRAVDDPALAALYSIAEVFVFPSLSEGFGWPPLEAMACGCPVIAARRASLPEVLGEACVYVDPTDTDAIAEAIRRVTADAALRSELVARGTEQSKNFGWGKTAERMLQLFASR